MKRLLCLLLVMAAALTLCACGSNVPGLGLNWGMSPEEVQKAVSAEMRVDQLENNAYIICFDSDNIPKVMGQKVLVFECRFDNYKLWNVNVTFDATADYDSLVKKCTSKYGEPTSMPEISKFVMGGVTYSTNALGWLTDDSAIVITYHDSFGMKMLDKMAFYSLSIDEGATDSSQQGQSESETPASTPEPTAEPTPAATLPEISANEDWAGELSPAQVLEDLRGDWVCKEDESITLTVREDGTILFDGRELEVDSMHCFVADWYTLYGSMGSLDYHDGILEAYDLPGLKGALVAFERR